MGMSVEAYLASTPRQLRNKAKGFFDAENDRYKQEWERARWGTWVLLNVQLDQKSRIKSPERLLPFSWEKKKVKPAKPKGITDEEKKEIVELFNKRK
jgi:hypothetical protein